MGSNRTFVITDANDNDNILAIPDSDGPFDLNGAGDGVCDIWYLAYEDIEGLATGNSLSDLTGNFALSNPVTVVRQSPDGGTVTTLGGSSDTTVTAGNALVTVAHTTTADRLSFWYIITDDQDNILGFANAANTNTLDLSAAPPGVCRIWGWSYRGEGDPVVGDPITSLTDGDCETISTGFVTVNREAEGGSDENVRINEVTAGGVIELFNGTGATVDVSSYWLCDFPSYQRVGTLALECGEDYVLEPGEFISVAFGGFDANDGEMGLFLNRSFSSASSLISYLEWGSSGHGRSNVAVAAGLWSVGAVVPVPPAGQSLLRVPGQTGSASFVTGASNLCQANAGSTSTRNIDFSSAVNLYPNPVGGNQVRVMLDEALTQEATIEILDLTGRQRLRRTVSAGTRMIQLSTDQMAAGSYLLRVVSGRRIATKRLLRQ